ncbi:hypothetical protein [Sunxiuqinia elliptica]|uniref:Uncharacterized protein n=1 Tax=Sunxiuqinia elliptica TaxID=655355 RepID=A0A1I2FRC9_9BACT|nr:hypothetical protein [Sunxiuqinia elliptica]SFF08002.1 hypothetical protein SAMN05216283_102589 [Sunxiuqinia elliptica]
MRTSVKILFTVISLIIVIILVNIFGPNYDEIRNQAYKSLKFDLYDGIIVEKYLDKDNHNYPTMKINTTKGLQVVRLPLDKSGLFEFVEIKDSIFKDYGSYNVEVYRNNEVYNFILDYGIEH